MEILPSPLTYIKKQKLYKDYAQLTLRQDKIHFIACQDFEMTSLIE